MLIIYRGTAPPVSSWTPVIVRSRVESPPGPDRSGRVHNKGGWDRKERKASPHPFDPGKEKEEKKVELDMGQCMHLR